MGISFIEGFDWAGSAGSSTGVGEKWGVSNSGTGLSLVTGRDGVGQALRFASGQVTTQISRPTSKSLIDALNHHFVMGFAFRLSAYPTAHSMIMQLTGGTTTSIDSKQGALVITTAGGLGWSDTANGLEKVWMAHANLVQLNVWHHVSINVEIEDATGSGHDLEIYFDGKPQIFPTTRILRTIQGDPVTGFNFGPRVAVGTFDVDDVWLLDPDDAQSPTTQIGDKVVATVYPDGDGNTSAWTLFGGASDWESVDEGAGVDHDGNTTYVSSQTLGQQSLFTLGAIPAATETVESAVAINYVSSKEAALGGPGFHAVKRTSTTTVVDDTFVMQSGQDDYLNSQKIWHSDGLDATWTEATINSSEFGMEVES